MPNAAVKYPPHSQLNLENFSWPTSVLIMCLCNSGGAVTSTAAMIAKTMSTIWRGADARQT